MLTPSVVKFSGKIKKHLSTNSSLIYCKYSNIQLFNPMHMRAHLHDQDSLKNLDQFLITKLEFKTARKVV